MPKLRVRPEKQKSIEKMWKCPGCGAEIKTVFDGQMTRFYYSGKEFAGCGGTYESFETECPGCGNYISWSKEELEKEVAKE